MNPIVLAGHPPTANQLQRMHPIARSNSRSQWSKVTYYAALDAGWKDSGISPAILEVEYVYHVARRRDIDNLIAGLKGVIDGLVIAGVLPDDSLDHLRGIEVTQSIDKTAEPGIRLSVVRALGREEAA